MPGDPLGGVCSVRFAGADALPAILGAIQRARPWLRHAQPGAQRQHLAGSSCTAGTLPNRARVTRSIMSCADHSARHHRPARGLDLPHVGDSQPAGPKQQGRAADRLVVLADVA
jgi:hypothetical protein